MSVFALLSVFVCTRVHMCVCVYVHRCKLRCIVRLVARSMKVTGMDRCELKCNMYACVPERTSNVLLRACVFT